MRELYVVSVSPDGRHVVLSSAKGAETGTHRVRLDARLLAAVRGELGQRPVDLSPRDIQARLRTGESAEDIARAAGVPVTRIERYAGPVAGEMARMIAAAREARVVRGRRGPSSVDLGTAVDTSLGGADATWTARREDDGRWRVIASWVARGRARDAAWLYEPHEKVLVAADPASASLGHVDPNPPSTRRTAKASPPRKARLQVVPNAPAPVKRAPQKRTKATASDERDGVRTRATVPGWADVLLGTTPGTDR